MRRDFGGRAALTTHRYTESDDFKPQKARYWPVSSRCLGTTCPAQLGVHELCVSVADALREDFDGVEAAVTDNLDIGRRADHYRKHGTTVASSVSFLFRDNTLEVRAVPLRTAVDATAASIAEITWKTLGLRGGRRTPDPWPDICAADVVITHAGQSCVADVAAARRPAIVLPQPRPFDEQHATAETLRRHRLAVATRGWPDARAWRYFIGHARASDPSRWERRQTTGAAARAAEAIDTAVCQYATPGLP